MAMIKCEKCGKEISDKSTSCIYCGVTLALADLHSKENKVKVKDKKELNTKIVIIELIIIFILVVAYINLFGERISQYVDENREIQLEETCNDKYMGTWNKEEGICKTRTGDIKIK